MKTLIIHHIEETFEKTFYNTTKESLTEFVIELSEYLEKTQFDKIILTQFEYNEKDLFYRILSSNFYIQLEEYGYGWDEKDDCNTWIDGGLHSRFLPVPNFLEQLKKDDIKLCGIFDGECLEDLQILLNTFDISYERLEKFIR